MILGIYGGSGAGKTYLLNRFFNAPADYNINSVLRNEVDIVTKGNLVYLPEITSGLTPQRETRLFQILELDAVIVTDVNANGGFATRYFRDRDMRCVILTTTEIELRRNLNSRKAFDVTKPREFIVDQTLHTQNKLLKRGWESFNHQSLEAELDKIAKSGSVDIGSSPVFKAAPRKRGRLDKDTVMELVRLSESMTVGELSDKYRIEPMSVRRILRGGRWSRVTGIPNTWRKNRVLN